MKFALSSRTSRVSAVTSDVRPPITPAIAIGPLGIADQQVGVGRACDRRRRGCASAPRRSRAARRCRARQTRQVEAVQRLPELEHRVVRRVDDRVDRTHARGDEARLGEQRRGPMLHPANDPRQVPRTCVVRLDPHGDDLRGRLVGLGHRHLGLAQRHLRSRRRPPAPRRAPTGSRAGSAPPRCRAPRWSSSSARREVGPHARGRRRSGAGSPRGRRRSRALEASRACRRTRRRGSLGARAARRARGPARPAAPTARGRPPPCSARRRRARPRRTRAGSGRDRACRSRGGRGPRGPGRRRRPPGPPTGAGPPRPSRRGA